MPFNIGSTELIVLLLVLVLLFGATRLPKAAEGIGKSLKVFKREIKTEDDEDDGNRTLTKDSQTKQSDDQQQTDVREDASSEADLPSTQQK